MVTLEQYKTAATQIGFWLAVGGEVIPCQVVIEMPSAACHDGRE